MGEVTAGAPASPVQDPASAEHLLPLVYDELRQIARSRLAHERPGQTLQATALVHEAYLRLVKAHGESVWNSRSHFFAAAAEAMRRILIEAARQKASLKRGGCFSRLALSSEELVEEPCGYDVVAVDEAITLLAQQHPAKAELVKLRYFAGLTLAEAATALGISGATADRNWRYARAWLAQQLRETAP